MEKPMEIVLIRHGLSEHNMVTNDEKRGIAHKQSAAVYSRHDSEQRLSAEGIEQTRLARQWLIGDDMAPENYDERYASPYLRTLETAAWLGSEQTVWLPEPNIVERDWGIYGATPYEDRRHQYADVDRFRKLSSFFVRLTGGESVHDVTLRFRDFMNKLTREMSDKKVMAVTHGEFMWAGRFVIERMLPTEWQALDEDKALRIGNCCILQYSRQNPENPEDVAKSLSNGWRRMVDPVDEKKSPYGGEWVRLNGKRYFDRQQILGMVGVTPRLINDELVS